jgi:hypothetical protein
MLKLNLKSVLLLSAMLFLPSAEAMATCRGNFRLEFNHTSQENWTMKSNTTCQVVYNFDYVAFYGLSVRERPRHGVIQVSGNKFTYTPAKGFMGQDRFVIEADGAYVNQDAGVVGARGKAGTAVTIQVQ